MPRQSHTSPSSRIEHQPRSETHQGGSALYYERTTAAGRRLDAALEAEVPGRARVYDEAGARWLIVSPHDEHARHLFREHFPEGTTKPGVFTPPRLRGAIRRAEILQEPAALFTLASTVLVTVPSDDEDANAFIAHAVPETARHLHRNRSVWELRPPHAWPVVERLLDTYPGAPVGGCYPCDYCGKTVNAATLARRAGRRAA